MQKFETLGVWEIGRREVIEAIDPKPKDVLKICGTSDNVTDGVACALYGDQTRSWKVRQNLNEYFCRKAEKGVRQRHVGGQQRLIWRNAIVALFNSFQLGLGMKSSFSAWFVTFFLSKKKRRK